MLISNPADSRGILPHFHPNPLLQAPFFIFSIYFLSPALLWIIHKLTIHHSPTDIQTGTAFVLKFHFITRERGLMERDFRRNPPQTKARAANNGHQRLTFTNLQTTTLNLIIFGPITKHGGRKWGRGGDWTRMSSIPRSASCQSHYSFWIGINNWSVQFRTSLH